MRSTLFSTKKRTVGVIAAGALLVATAGGAYAYWTTTGAGTGTATTASENGTLTLHGHLADGLAPGNSTEVTFTADNPGTSSLYVTSVHLAAVTVDENHAGCEVADFSMTDVSSGTRVLAETTGQALQGSGELVFADTGVNQDACKGAEITLHLTSD